MARRLSTSEIHAHIAHAQAAREKRAEQGRVLIQATTTAPATPSSKHVRYKASAGEARGIPLMGATMASGAMPGTRPDRLYQEWD